MFEKEPREAVKTPSLEVLEWTQPLREHLALTGCASSMELDQVISRIALQPNLFQEWSLAFADFQIVSGKCLRDCAGSRQNHAKHFAKSLTAERIKFQCSGIFPVTG